MSFRRFAFAGLFALSLAGFAAPAQADCAALPKFEKLQEVLRASVKASGGAENGGFELNMWASLVDRDGVVCAVAFSGQERGDQWPGSRVIAAQKANTANAFSLNGLALSTANLYSAVQPGGSLYGLQFSNPVNTAVAYGGDAAEYGTAADPMVGQRVGGVNIFGGGLALYSKDGIVGGLGVSGDSACADHNVAWRVRQALDLAAVPGGVSKAKTDAIIYDVVKGKSKSGFGHPLCGGKENKVGMALKAAE